MYLSGYHQVPSGVENPDQVKYDKMDFSDKPVGSEQAAFSTWIFRAPLTCQHVRFGTSHLLHVKISSSTHPQRRGLCQDAKNWQDLWDVLVSSIQCKTSECRRGTFYFDINLNIYPLKFLSKRGATKVRGPEVVVQAPFRSVCDVIHRNLSLGPNKLWTTMSYHSTSNAPYTCLYRQKKQWNESTNDFTRWDFRIESVTWKRADHFAFISSTLPWLLHRPKHLGNDQKHRPESLGHLGDVNSHCLTACKASNRLISRLLNQREAHR